MRNYLSRPLPHLMLLLGCLAVGMLCVMAASAGINAANADGTFTIYALTGAQTIGMFLLPAWAAMRIVRRRAWAWLGLCRPPRTASALAAVFLAFVILSFITLTAAVNELLPLPDWVVQMEADAERLTEQLLMTGSWQRFWLNMLWAAALPAVAEEVFFRGFLQNVLHRLLGSAHWAILVTAVIFSAFHLQFVSFLPRLCMGILMGYMFYWSRSLWLPIIYHFINNAAGVFAYFHIVRSNISIEALSIDAAMNASTLLSALSAIAGGMVMFLIYCIESGKLREMRG